MSVLVDLIVEILFARIACISHIRDHQAESGVLDGTLPVHSDHIQVQLVITFIFVSAKVIIIGDDKAYRLLPVGLGRGSDLHDVVPVVSLGRVAVGTFEVLNVCRHTVVFCVIHRYLTHNAVMRTFEIDIDGLLDMMHGIVSDGDLDVIALDVPVGGSK